MSKCVENSFKCHKQMIPAKVWVWWSCRRCFVASIRSKKAAQSLSLNICKKKNAYFVYHQSCCQNSVVPMLGTIAAASCLSCHIFLTRSHKELGGQSGWWALIDTHLNFNSELHAHHYCCWSCFKSMALSFPSRVLRISYFSKNILVFYGSCLFINLWY